MNFEIDLKLALKLFLKLIAPHSKLMPSYLLSIPWPRGQVHFPIEKKRIYILGPGLAEDGWPTDYLCD